MALSWRDSIYQWLSKTTEDSQPRSARGMMLCGIRSVRVKVTDFVFDADHSPTVGSAKHPVTVPADLEALNAAQGSTPGKRTRGADQKDAREQHPPKKARNEYERRPRHKTREDRYDYKPSGSTSKPQSRQEKTKRLRRGRKQTMNDGFHASNVARERLTVRTSLMILS